MSWTKQKKFIAYSILVLAFMQAICAGSISYMGYYMTEAQELYYPHILFVMIMCYLRAIGCKTRGSLNFGLMYCLLNALFVPYMLIKRYKWLKGFAFILIWVMLLMIGDLSWLIIDIIFWS